MDLLFIALVNLLCLQIHPRTCPVCKADVVQATIANTGDPLAPPLRRNNPLAHRILGRVQVQCPLSEQVCGSNVVCFFVYDSMGCIDRYMCLQ